MRKVAIVIGSRANWGRLKSVVKAVDAHPNLQLQLIIGASAIDLPIEYPYEAIQCLVDSDNCQGMVLTTGLFLTQIGGVFERLQPDIVLIHGDRHEMLAVATAAAYMNIKLAHTEGGDVTGTIDERVRHAITKLADIHFPVTEQSARRIVAMGEYPDMVFVVGSTALDSLVGIDLTNPRTKPYIVVLHHPVTTAPEDIKPLIEAVSSLPIHKCWINPNTDAGSKAMLRQIHRQDVEFVKNLPVEEYARLLYNCECAVGNSSSFIKEGAFLGTPAVLVGDRQKGREVGRNVRFVRNDADSIRLMVQEMMGRRFPRDYRFGDGKAGQRIAEILSQVEVREKKYAENTCLAAQGR